MGRCLKLLQVQAYFRHGARTPLHHVQSTNTKEAFWVPEMAIDLPCTLYPHKIVDICSNEEVMNALQTHLPPPSKLPGGLYTGILTQAGQKDAFELGRRFKNLYIDQKGFISRTLNTEEIYCRSSLIARTLQSMRCVAAGLFGEGYHETGQTETLMIYVEPLEREYIFPNPSTCGLLGKLYKEGVEEYLHLSSHLALKRKLKTILGVEKLVDDIRPQSYDQDCPIYFVRDDYVARQRAGFPLPPKLDLLFPEMHTLSSEELCYELLGRKSEWQQNLPCVMGRVFQMILCNMRKFENVPKFQLYSCHDSTLILLLLALNCFDGIWPPFAADVVLELYAIRDLPDPKAKQQPNDCPEEESHSPPPSEPDPPVTEEDLWIRVLYLGRVVPLACLWEISSIDVELAADGYVPLASLVDRWTTMFEACQCASHE